MFLCRLLSVRYEVLSYRIVKQSEVIKIEPNRDLSLPITAYRLLTSSTMFSWEVFMST